MRIWSKRFKKFIIINYNIVIVGSWQAYRLDEMDEYRQMLKHNQKVALWYARQQEDY